MKNILIVSAIALALFAAPAMAGQTAEQKAAHAAEKAAYKEGKSQINAFKQFARDYIKANFEGKDRRTASKAVHSAVRQAKDNLRDARKAAHEAHKAN